MNVKLQNLKKKFLEINDMLYEKEFLSEEENEVLSEEYVGGDLKIKERILEIYDYEYDEKTCKFHFYKLVPAEISDTEFEQYISIKTLEGIKAVNEKLDTIKFILLLWFVLVIVGVGLLFLLGLK